MTDGRYDGKPMLRLLDSWVLWVIGASGSGSRTTPSYGRGQ